MMQLFAIFERTTDGAMIVDGEGKIIFWNLAAERLLGFKAREVVGRPCCEVIRGETLSGRPLCSSTCPIAERIRSGGGVRHFDMQTRTKDGHLLWLNVSSLPVPSRKRGVFWIVHLFRNITKQAKAYRLVEKLHKALCVPTPTVAPDKDRQDCPVEHALSLPLTKREWEVLRLLSGGATSARIAETLCISPKTVRNHIQHILEKLGAHNRLEALAIAFSPGAHSTALDSSPAFPSSIQRPAR